MKTLFKLFMTMISICTHDNLSFRRSSSLLYSFAISCYIVIKNAMEGSYFIMLKSTNWSCVHCKEKVGALIDDGMQLIRDLESVDKKDVLLSERTRGHEYKSRKARC